MNSKAHQATTSGASKIRFVFMTIQNTKTGGCFHVTRSVRSLWFEICVRTLCSALCQSSMSHWTTIFSSRQALLAENRWNSVTGNGISSKRYLITNRKIAVIYYFIMVCVIRHRYALFVMMSDFLLKIFSCDKKNMLILVTEFQVTEFHIRT